MDDFGVLSVDAQDFVSKWSSCLLTTTPFKSLDVGPRVDWCLL